MGQTGSKRKQEAERRQETEGEHGEIFEEKIGPQYGREMVDVMKGWVGKERAEIIFDSDVDEFTNRMFNIKCLDKPNIAVIGFTTEGDVFGGYLEKEVSETDKLLTDPNHFIFSLESHGRCKTPMRWMRKNEKRQRAVWWQTNYQYGFITFGDGEAGHLYLGNMETNPFCHYLSWDYQGIEDRTLTGKNGTCEFHHCRRLVVLQFY